MVLQCRGHLITEGMHPQYDLFKQWAAVKRPVLEERLEDRYILFGEWVYARHSVHYRQLPHYFFEFDIYDKRGGDFLSLERRLALLEGTGIHTVPVLHVGAIGPGAARGLDRSVTLRQRVREPAHEAHRQSDGRVVPANRGTVAS